MAENILISLQPERQASADAADPAALDLGQLIKRIIAERGSFVNITEDLLAQEVDSNESQIAASEAAGLDVSAPGADGDEMDESEVAVETTAPVDFDHTRAELVQLIRTAQNESALSLDFVSLLISCLRPAAGTTSMSPHLKQHVPVGSLSADTLWIQVPEEEPAVATGWKLQSLGTASSRLHSAAARLKGEIFKEERYWSSVLDEVVQGELLFKIRRGDARGLGIKYGFGDSGSEYRDRGLAMMHRRPDGSMVFRSNHPKKRKAVKVSLYDVSAGSRVLMGSSTPAILLPEDSVHNEVRNARTLLFEEELFYEMVQEARLLASYKIVVVDGKIQANLHDEVLEIEYADIEGEVESLPDDKGEPRADLLCNALHILLCYAHRRRLEKRRQHPAPVASKAPKPGTTAPPSQPPNKELFILRPLVAHIQHHKIVKRTQRLLDMMLQNQKGVELTLNTQPAPAAESRPSCLGKLLFPPVSEFKLEFADRDLEVTIVTSSPLQSQGPLHDVKAINIKSGEVISNTGLYELSELENWLNWILKRA